jgi:hypothetical protein
LLTALAAAFAPARAAACLSRAPDAALAAEAARLAPLPRAERLDALASALVAQPPPSPRARELVAAAERPRVAAVVRGVGGGAVRPLFARLVLERVSGSNRFRG